MRTTLLTGAAAGRSYFGVLKQVEFCEFCECGIELGKGSKVGLVNCQSTRGVRLNQMHSLCKASGFF